MDPPTAKPVRVFLVAEHSALRKSLEMLLEDEGLAVCSAAPSGAGVLSELSAGADVMVVGLSGGWEGGLDLIRELASRPRALP